MISEDLTREELWACQQISARDVNYDGWAERKKALQEASDLTGSYLFTVDVYKGRYSFASENFASLLGFRLSQLKHIEEEGDFLEERIHPEDHERIIDMQIKHSHFVYSLPLQNRNDYRNIFQFRIRNRQDQYIHVISRHQVLQQDCNGKAWIVVGSMELSPDQTPSEQVKYISQNRKTGDLICFPSSGSRKIVLTTREKEILSFISQGMLSKEIADKLHLSIYTVHNHRKNILAKLEADNSIEAILFAKKMGLLE